MKKLIAKLTILIFLLLILVGVVEFLSLNPATKEKIAVLTNSEDFLEGDTSDVDQVILSAREDDGSKVLVLGDSIARQMFQSWGRMFRTDTLPAPMLPSTSPVST
jgi:hypothetical protein